MLESIFTRSTFTLHSLYAHSTLPLPSLYAHSMLTLRSLYIHSTLTLHSLYTSLYTLHLSPKSIPNWFILKTLLPSPFDVEDKRKGRQFERRVWRSTKGRRSVGGRTIAGRRTVARRTVGNRRGVGNRKGPSICSSKNHHLFAHFGWIAARAQTGWIGPIGTPRK